MEFLIGAAVTMISYIITQKIVRNKFERQQIVDIKYSQSHIYQIVKPYLEFAQAFDVPENTQAANYIKNAYMKVMIVKNKAYWIKDNTFFTAEVVNGQVQKETAKEVDTMTMNKVELNEMLFIVEKLRGGSDDYRGSGK
jgi:hypothetical protein